LGGWWADMHPMVDRSTAAGPKVSSRNGQDVMISQRGHFRFTDGNVDAESRGWCINTTRRRRLCHLLALHHLVILTVAVVQSDSSPPCPNSSLRTTCPRGSRCTTSTAPCTTTRRAWTWSTGTRRACGHLSAWSRSTPSSGTLSRGTVRRRASLFEFLFVTSLACQAMDC